MTVASSLSPEVVLNSIREGVYVTDTSRRIIYWGKAAERITGWTAEDVVGKCCHDGILCHEDKDGHLLCGTTYCPLYRAMLTGKGSRSPIIMFARTKNGGRVPLQAEVSPLHNAAGEVIGGVETFRDLSDEFADFERARRIQLLSLQHDLPLDSRIRFTARYLPHDIIGGDFYAVARLDADRYGLLLADVTGHGVPAALYTMFLSSLWSSHQHLLFQPVDFVRAINQRLHSLIQEEEPFACALCGLFDLEKGGLRLVGAGNPYPLFFRANGSGESVVVPGLPLGIIEDAKYAEVALPIKRGDCFLFFTDGAVEIPDTHGQNLGVEGLRRVLREAGYPGEQPNFGAIESGLLAASNRIRLDDDVTFVDVRMT